VPLLALALILRPIGFKLRLYGLCIAPNSLCLRSMLSGGNVTAPERTNILVTVTSTVRRVTQC